MFQTVSLGSVSKYISEKVTVEDIALIDYVSTENLLHGKGGLSLASKLPQSGKVTKYQKNDVLVSNIRPYFKKIWYADRSGGASNDVLVVRSTSSDIDSRYLYYVLADDRFFEYSTTSSGGSKMPRGDKMQIMKYPLFLPSLDEQMKIADTLRTIDEKIELNQKMNETLEQMGQALFRHYFITNPDVEKWDTVLLGDYLVVERGLSYKGAFLSDNPTDTPMINLGSFSTNGTYNAANIKYYNGEFKQRSIVSPTDLVVANTDMTQDRVVLGSVLSAPDLAEKMIYSHHVYGLKDLKLSKEFVFYLLKRPQFRERAQGFATGTTVLFLPSKAITKLEFRLPDDTTLARFDTVARNIHCQIELLRKENEQLIDLRDTLLPRLISGKVRI